MQIGLTTTRCILCRHWRPMAVALLNRYPVGMKMVSWSSWKSNCVMMCWFYTSAPLEEPLVVVGPVEVNLFAQSSAPDTDFTAKLVDVRPDGATHNIVDGVVRASLREGYRSQPSLIEPGKTYEYSIPLGPVATVFPKGHRIRLQISSSSFPKLARNLNTGKSNYTTAETAIAQQIILHDDEHQSRLILPIVANVVVPSMDISNAASEPDPAK